MEGSEATKQLINKYRSENILLRDKLDNYENNIVEDLKKEIELLNKMVSKKEEERCYWKVKFDKKVAWFWT